MKNRKTIALFLALLMLFSTAAGCSNADSGETNSSNTASTDTVVQETETERPYAQLPDTDMGGADMPILVGYNVEPGTENFGVSKNEFGAAEITGEAVNDARYARNQAIGERFNCVISSVEQHEISGKTVYHEDMKKAVDTLVMAGDNNYAFMLLQGYTTCSLATGGTLNDLYTMDNIDFDAAWWDQKANENLTVMDKLYFTTGDISTADNDATCTVFFNKQLAADHGIENLYDTVRDGTWPLDKFLSLCEETSLDVDGDGKYTEADQYGAMIWDDITMAVINGAGIKCAQTNENGEIELTLNTERTINALEKYLKFGRDPSQCFQYQRKDNSDTLAIKTFSNNQAMFYMQLMQLVPKLRDMDADFGILPFPKYDEDQAEYYNTVGSWHSVFFCMPFGNVDTTNASILAEALACEGMYTVTPAYYEMTLKNKATRDEDSAEMLDIIFATRVYDLGWYYQFGLLNEEVMNLFRTNYAAKEFSSMYASKEKKALEEVKKANEAFAAVAEQ